MRTKLAKRIFISCIWLSLVAVQAFAQSGNQGSITGTAVDPSEAVVAEAALTATSVATGATYSTTTSGEGSFSFAVLPVGVYEITASKQGFATAKYSVEVTIGAKLNLKLPLAVNANVESVVLHAIVPVVETTRTQVSS